MQLDVGQAKGMSSTEKALADYLMKKKKPSGGSASVCCECDKSNKSFSKRSI